MGKIADTLKHLPPRCKHMSPRKHCQQQYFLSVYVCIHFGVDYIGDITHPGVHTRARIRMYTDAYILL